MGLVELFNKVDWESMETDEFMVFMAFSLSISHPESIEAYFNKLTLSKNAKAEFSRIMLSKEKEYGVELPTQLHVLFTQNL